MAGRGSVSIRLIKLNNGAIVYYKANENFIASLTREVLRAGLPKDARILELYAFFNYQKNLTGHESFGEWLKSCGYPVPSKEAQGVVANYIKSEAELCHDPTTNKEILSIYTWTKSIDNGLIEPLLRRFDRVYRLEGIGFMVRDALRKLNHQN